MIVFIGQVVFQNHLVFRLKSDIRHVVHHFCATIAKTLGPRNFESFFILLENARFFNKIPKTARPILNSILQIRQKLIKQVPKVSLR